MKCICGSVTVNDLYRVSNRKNSELNQNFVIICMQIANILELQKH